MEYYSYEGRKQRQEIDKLRKEIQQYRATPESYNDLLKKGLEQKKSS